MKELSLHILDIAQNSIVAGATIISILVNEDPFNDLLTIEIEDNGKGIPAEMLQNVKDPYSTTRTTRRVGMGLPLLNDACWISGGELEIESREGAGTKVTATLGLNHIDRQPIGDMAGVIVLLVSANPKIEFQYTHIKGENTFSFSTEEVKEVLEGLPLNSPEVVKTLREMIKLNLDEL